LLIPSAGFTDLSLACPCAALFAAIALPTIATHANGEHRAAVRMKTRPQPENSFLLSRSRHSEIMPSPILSAMIDDRMMSFSLPRREVQKWTISDDRQQ